MNDLIWDNIHISLRYIKLSDINFSEDIYRIRERHIVISPGVTFSLWQNELSCEIWSYYGSEYNNLLDFGLWRHADWYVGTKLHAVTSEETVILNLKNSMGVL
jgi:hypothetical protein